MATTSFTAEEAKLFFATHLHRQTGGAQRRAHSQIKFPKRKINFSGFNRKLTLLYSRVQTCSSRPGDFSTGNLNLLNGIILASPSGRD